MFDEQENKLQETDRVYTEVSHSLDQMFFVPQKKKAASGAVRI